MTDQCENGKFIGKLFQHKKSLRVTYGSVTHGNITEKSDEDVMLVAKASVVRRYRHRRKFSINNANYTVVTRNVFLNNLKKYSPVYIEVYLRYRQALEFTDKEFSINKANLVKSFIEHSKHSFDKVDRLFAVDEYKGRKSLFHAIRLLIYASNFYHLNKINFICANIFFDLVMNSKDLSSLKEFYIKLYQKSIERYL